MMLLYSFNFWLLLASAVFFYRAAEFDEEGGSGIVWASLSILVSLLIWLKLKWGLLGMIIGQVALLVGIGLIRVFRKPD
jgi:hypothetical protein